MVIKNGVLTRVTVNDLDSYGRFVVPINVKSIGAYAFYGLGELKEIVITRNVKNIGESAFEDCDNLVDVNIESDIDTIGQT